MISRVAYEIFPYSRQISPDIFMYLVLDRFSMNGGISLFNTRNVYLNCIEHCSSKTSIVKLSISNLRNFGK